MSDQGVASSTDSFCIGCGYSLRGLPSPRCPECGRQFDPTDPATMSIGRPLRAWQRSVFRPTSLAIVFPALLGTAQLIYLSGWPGIAPEPLDILRQELHWSGWSPTPEQLLFLTAFPLWGLFLLFWLPRKLLRLTIPRRIRQRNTHGRDPLRREQVVAIFALVSVILVFFGWHQRIARRWIADQPGISQPMWWGVEQYSSGPPIGLTPAQCSDVLYRPLVNLPTPQQRLDVLRMLIEYGGSTQLPALLHAEKVEKDPTVLQWELRAIGLFRDPSTEDVLTRRLDDPRSAVRAAAIDALGILRGPSYSILKTGGFWVIPPISLGLNPPAVVGNVVDRGPPANTLFSGTDHDLMDEPTIPIAGTTRSRFERAMIGGASDEEREAAARALVAWPPASYQLRVAEWGVWVENDGHLSIVKSIVDEIPPFVHRTGNELANLDAYFRYPSEVTKPVIHITSDVPLAVDLEVHIRQGRPWFAFPYPDDFGVGNEADEVDSGNAAMVPLNGQGLWFRGPLRDPPELAASFDGVLSDCREGYPWLLPHHRVYSSSSTGRGGPPAIYGVGVRWQSLIVSPARLGWMTPPSVSSDPRFGWWSRLRDVPADWVWNRGEAERFLYYDGPTESFAPLAVGLRGRRLVFDEHVFKYPDPRTAEELPVRRAPQLVGTLPAGLPVYEGMYIEVRDGVVTAEQMQIQGTSSHDLPPSLPLAGPAVAARFREMLVVYGLTGAEADGLLAAWSPWLFHAEGRRFILRMPPGDYARQCPMWMRPAPTQVVRLGLVLSEFGKGDEGGH